MTQDNTPSESPRKRGFAAMDKERVREIAAEGGRQSPGNFARDPKRAAEAGSKGGRA